MGGAVYYAELDELYRLIKKIGFLSTDNEGLNPNTFTAFGQTATAEETPIVQLQFPYNINSRLVDTYTGGAGTVTHSTDGFAVLNTAATSDSYAEFSSKRPVKYNTGQGCVVRFTALWSSGVPGSKQFVGIGSNGAGSAGNGFYFGYNGEQFGICRSRNGVENWTYTSDWNKWNFPDLDTSKGNVYQIRYQWLGYGAQSFFIEDPNSGAFREVHQIKYANSTEMTSVFNPTMRLRAMVANSSNNTDIELKVPSFAGFIEGKNAELGLDGGLSNTITTVSTQRIILALHNSTTYQGVENQVEAKLVSVSFATDGTKIATVKAIYNPTVTTSSGGAMVWNNYSTDTSIMQYATSSGATFTGGSEVASFSLGKTDSLNIQGTQETVIYLEPGDTFVLTGETAGINDFSGSIRWKELF